MNKCSVILFLSLIISIASNAYANNVAGFKKQFPQLSRGLSDNDIEEIVIRLHAQSLPNQQSLLAIMELVDQLKNDEMQGEILQQSSLLINRVPVLKTAMSKARKKKSVRFEGVPEVDVKSKLRNKPKRRRGNMPPTPKTEQELEQRIKEASKIAEAAKRHEKEGLSEAEYKKQLDQRQHIAEEVAASLGGKWKREADYFKRPSEIDENAVVYYEAFQKAANAINQNKIAPLVKAGRSQSPELQALKNQHDALMRLGMYFQYPHGKTIEWDEDNQPVRREDMYAEAMKALNLVNKIPAFREAQSALVSLYAANDFNEAANAFGNAAKFSELPEMARAFTSAVEGVNYLHEQKRRRQWR